MQAHDWYEMHVCIYWYGRRARVRTWACVWARVSVWARVRVCACGHVYKLVLSTQARAYIHTHTRSCACACACWCTRREHVREKSERWLPLVSSPGNSTCTTTQSAACRWACSTPLRRFSECTRFDALCISSSSPPPLSACLASFPSVFHLSLHPPPPRCIWISSAHTRPCMHVCACMHTHTLNQSRVNIHMFVYSFTYACTHAHIHLHICMCIGACSCVSVCICIRISAYIYVYSYFCVHIWIYLYEKDVWLCIPAYVPACICMYMHTCMLTCMYISICRHMHLEMHSPTYTYNIFICRRMHLEMHSPTYT